MSKPGYDATQLKHEEGCHMLRMQGVDCPLCEDGTPHNHKGCWCAPNFMADIQEFHEKFGLAYDGRPRALPTSIADFRQLFMEEELSEYKEARQLLELAVDLGNEKVIIEGLEDQLDALVDLLYVALGTAYLQGFNINEAWRRVHRANMSKVRAADASQSARGSHWDVIKPDNWVAPSHTDLVEDHAHKDDK